MCYRIFLFYSLALWEFPVFLNLLLKTREKKYFISCFLSLFFLVAFGSAYYHWTLSNYALMWDRIPIAIAMTAFIAAMMSERIDLPFGRFMLWPLLALSVFSVYSWYYTASQGHEDLRLYAFTLVFFPLIITPLILLFFKSSYTQVKYIWFALLTFVIARICETYDAAVYNCLGHSISGHTLKHLLIALSCFFIFCYLGRRSITSN